MNQIQLNISLEKSSNPLRDTLNSGNFVFLAEAGLPESSSTLADAYERIKPLAEKMWSFDDLCGGLAITDLPGSAFSAAEFASAIPEQFRNRNLFYLSGSGRSANEIAGELKIAAGAGIENIVAVSGEAWGGSLQNCRARNYSGTLQILDMLRESASFWYGSTVNPYHYQEAAMLGTLDYFRKKLLAGSEYTVIQAGWDMLQTQTLFWYMLRNNFYLPAIVRIVLLTPEKIEKIVSGELPGLRISKDFRKQLEQELCGSSAQFEAAQYRRLELQVAGARLLGASGVQISGINFPGKAEIIARRIRSALEEFKSFEHWLDEYNHYQAELEMTMSLNNFRLYDRVLRRNYPFDAPPVGKESSGLKLTGSERFKHRLCRKLFRNAHLQKASRDRLLKKLLVSCRSCSKCRLPQHEFVCVENCPKRLNDGPCGGIRENGMCEIGNFECIHAKIVRFSSDIKRCFDLE